MPGRRNTVRIETIDVQGDDSFVVVRRATVKEMRVVSLKRQEATKAESPMDFYGYYAAFVCEHVIDWNWVDDDGEPLTKPKQDKTVYDALTSSEIDCLDTAIFGTRTEEEQKN